MSTEWPEAVPFPPQTISMSGFMSLYETNHLWISHPFFTRKRVCVYFFNNNYLFYISGICKIIMTIEM